MLFAAVRADGVMLKALSILAAAYLPASLVAVSRCSDDAAIIADSARQDIVFLKSSSDSLC